MSRRACLDETSDVDSLNLASLGITKTSSAGGLRSELEAADLLVVIGKREREKTNQANVR